MEDTAVVYVVWFLAGFSFLSFYQLTLGTAVFGLAYGSTLPPFRVSWSIASVCATWAS